MDPFKQKAPMGAMPPQGAMKPTPPAGGQAPLGPGVVGGKSWSPLTRQQASTPGFQGQSEDTDRFRWTQKQHNPKGVPMGQTTSNIGPKGAVGAPLGTGNSPGDWTERIRQMFGDLNAPLNLQDPRVATILNGAFDRAAQSAGNRGIGGPMSQTAAQGAYVNAAAQMDMQRRQQALQALGLGTQQSNQMFQFGQQQFGQGMDGIQGIGALAGGGAGGIISLIAGLATQNPQLAMQLMQVLVPAMSQMGAGVGGMGAGSGPSPWGG